MTAEDLFGGTDSSYRPAPPFALNEEDPSTTLTDQLTVDRLNTIYQEKGAAYLLALLDNELNR